MMSSHIIGVLMACAAVTIGTCVGWVLAYALSPLATFAPWPARSRAVLLAQLRVLPLASALLLTAAQSTAFVRYEQNRVESVGPLLVTLALVGVWLLVETVWHAARSWQQTLRVIREWRRNALPLSLPTWKGRAWAIRPAFPIVAVIGAMRPQLFVARQVVDRCTGDEMAAIVAHESAHVAARDNFTRLLFALTPGSRLMRGVAARIDQQWLVASEEAADVAASRDADSSALASALTKVARLAPVPATQMTAASALINGSDLETRVKRLLTPPVQPHPAHGAWIPTVALLGIAILTQIPQVSRSLHEVFELLVRSS